MLRTPLAREEADAIGEEAGKEYIAWPVGWPERSTMGLAPELTSFVHHDTEQEGEVITTSRYLSDA
jgi:hypothetical protein